jgi:hypothetical protein
VEAPGVTTVLWAVNGSAARLLLIFVVHWPLAAPAKANSKREIICCSRHYIAREVYYRLRRDLAALQPT